MRQQAKEAVYRARICVPIPAVTKSAVACSGTSAVCQTPASLIAYGDTLLPRNLSKSRASCGKDRSAPSADSLRSLPENRFGIGYLSTRRVSLTNSSAARKIVSLLDGSIRPRVPSIILLLGFFSKKLRWSRMNDQ